MWQLGLSLLRYLQGKFCDVISYDICTPFGSQLIISEKLSTFIYIFHNFGTLGFDHFFKLLFYCLKCEVKGKAMALCLAKAIM